MLVRSLEIQGFKTFPDKTVLEFNNGITAVVGPNGSGKSNISDAVRWVLGEQSVRALRCTRMEDVIFNGTPQRKALGFAEVTLHIDNTDRRLPFDNDHVAVTRRYYRSGESEYMINRVAVRLKDINELFMDTGLGRDGYSIIGQGKIDAIVAAKSEDRREIFEEAAGISRYRYRKAESERRLDAAEENLVRLRDILEELEGRVGPLKEQSEKAQAFLQYSEEKKGLEIGLWLKTLEQSAQTLRKQEDTILVARNQQEAAAAALEKADAAAEQNFQDMNACTAQIDRIRQADAGLEEAAAKKDGDASVLRNDARHCAETVDRLESEIRVSAEDSARLDEQAGQKEAAAAQKEQEVETHRSETDRLNARLEELRAGMNETAARIDEYTRQLSELSARATENKVAEMTASSSIAEISRRVSQSDTLLEQKQAQAEELEKSAQAGSAMLQQAAARVDALQNGVHGYELRLETRHKKEETQKQEADRLLLDAKESRRRADLLEALERNMEGFQKSVKMVMQAAQQGQLSGVHGPISRLIEAPPAYATALETALGASMQHIVVGTEQDAKQAIGFLKRRDGGRATFLPLSTIRGRTLQEQGLHDCSGFVGVASELCTSQAQYRGIRENLLGRIVIAKDLDTAVGIARKYSYRFRVVTLDGQVVNAGGSLTGGSLARNSGLLSRRGEIDRIRKKAQQQQEQADAATEALRALRAELAKEEANLSAARGELAAAKEERIRFAASLERLRGDLRGAQQDIDRLQAEKKAAAGRMEAQQAQQEKARAATEEITARSASVSAEMQRVSGSRTDLNRESDSYNRQVQEHRLQMLAAEKDAQSLRDAAAELRRQKSSSAARTETLRQQIAQAKAQGADFIKQAEASAAEAASLRRQASDGAKEIERLSARRLELEQEGTRLRQVQRDKSEEKETAGHELARLEERRESMQAQYDGILAKLWEEYELTRREAEQVAAPVTDAAKAQKRLNILKGQIRALGSVNVAAIEEYKEVSARYEFLSAQVADVEKSREELRHLIADLTRQMKEQFGQSFAQIARNFTETFRELFGGGTAKLELTDSEDILSAGIEIAVQPPGKIVSHLESLSGGEKALVAIALYFAIMKVSPPPFCMLDEIEAALDDVNVTRFAAYLRRMTPHTQFIVITHRRGSMEEADVLYGVTMQDEGVSKILELHPDAVSNYH